MDLFFKLVGLISVCLAVVTSVHGQDVCTAVGTCSCVFPNGTGIDLTPSQNQTLTTQGFSLSDNTYDISTFYYYPCVDRVQKVTNTSIPNYCNETVSICQLEESLRLDPNGTYKMNSTYVRLGTTKDFEFLPDASAIKYKNGPSYTTVMLVCAETEDRLHAVSLDDYNKLVLAVYSRNACLKLIVDHSGRSIGSTLCIILFCMLIFYLVLGICTKKFLMGATGIEVIPNLTFWTDLPNLVKDGWAFSLNGFKLPMRGGVPATSPDPNSYDSI